MDRSLLAVAVALLAVTAGCSGFAGQSSSTTDAPTETTAAPTTAEPTQTQPAMAAPGFAGGEVVDPLALAEAHRQHLSGSSFVRESERATSGDNETFSTMTLAFGNESRWSASWTFDGQPYLDVENGTVEQYVEADRLYYRLTPADGNVSYEAQQVPEGSSGTETTLAGQRYARDYVYSVFTTASWATIVGENTTSGTTVYRVVGNASGETTFRGNTVTDFEVAANVTGDGFVRDLRVTYQGEGVSVEQSFSFSAVGETTVERPDWYDTAVNRTDEPAP